MPLTTINLLSLESPTQLSSLLKFITDSNVKPLTVSKPLRWIVKPTNITAKALLEPRWDLLLILPDGKEAQDFLGSLLSPSPYDPKSQHKRDFKIHAHFSVKAGVPSRLTKDFLSTTNRTLLHPDSSLVPKLTGALDEPLLQDDSQSLTMSPELQAWIGTSPSSLPVQGAMSMLNFLAFKKGMKDSYLKYGAAFANTIGAKRGGNAKLVGNIIHDQIASPDVGNGDQKWDEFALAHYPSLLHFADMLASKDYQDVNMKYRVPALEDTCILATSELEIEKLTERTTSKAKL